ncbi:MAG: PPC domain-containing DNA-binding protein [Deltaproteobacteria bacterium]
MIIHHSEEKVLIVVPKGEKLVATLTRDVSDLGLKGGLISGLGALIDVELGYYHLEEKDYHRKTFSEMDYELISLTGNLSLKEGKPYIHVHAALGDNQFRVFGGHLFEANVAVTAEVSIIPLGKMPVRELDPKLGLATICRMS